MARRRQMSEALRADLGRQLGVADLARREGWGAVPAKQCGDLVRLAIERAERVLGDERGLNQPRRTW